jgi:hypothetical protein
LNEALVPGKTKLVEEQGQDYGRGETEKNFHAADNNGVAEDFPKFQGGNKGLKVFQADPGAAQDAQVVLVILKGQGSPVHGVVTEHQEEYDAGYHEQVYQPVFPDTYDKGFVGKITPRFFHYGTLLPFAARLVFE